MQTLALLLRDPPYEVGRSSRSIARSVRTVYYTELFENSQTSKRLTIAISICGLDST
jgi:hypothetical protein